ncbi:GAF domain-containing protein [Mycolicibacterium sp. XJ1819]
MEATDTQAAADLVSTVARQEAEIGRLRRLIAQDRFAQDLRDAMTTASAASLVGAPVSHDRLLDMITATATDIVKARAGSLFLIDAEQQNLIFTTAVGDQVTETERFRMPLGHGVAGLVALTGQPIAVSDTPEDDLDSEDLGHAVGFNPKNILCIPLSFRDQVIGVLQFLDKKDEATFSVDDMEDVALFSHLAAVAIEQSRTQHRLSVLVSGLIENIDGISDFDRFGLTEKARAFTTELGQQTGFLGAMELAQLIQEIVQHGDAAAETCKGLLGSFADFLRSHSGHDSAVGGARW